MFYEYLLFVNNKNVHFNFYYYYCYTFVLIYGNILSIFKIAKRILKKSRIHNTFFAEVGDTNEKITGFPLKSCYNFSFNHNLL